ncbi:MAG TPA: HDOD domain-containing protein [Gemmatimonadales bacterium]|nr:HDOD domain-containing protein [Gemmatimonadales bacterium]
MPYIINGMRDLLERGDNLPTLPTVVFQLHRVLDDERAGANDVAAIIEKDPALTARLLRAANSAAYSRGGDRLGSVSAAVARMGVNQVRAVCIVLAVVKAFAHREGGLDHETFWIHSATVGALARQLWDRFGDKPTVAGEDAYVAGLLHDTGLLVLEQHFFDDFAGVLDVRKEHGGRLWQMEEQHLGLDHGAVGGLLLGRWSLPPYIGEAVTNHHHPHQADESYQQLARVIQAAEVLATAGGAGLAEEGEADFSPSDVLTELGASEEDIEEILASVPILAERCRQFLS